MPARAAIGVAASALALLGIAGYRRDLRRDRQRLAGFAPSVIDTPFGRKFIVLWFSMTLG